MLKNNMFNYYKDQNVYNNLYIKELHYLTWKDMIEIPYDN